MNGAIAGMVRNGVAANLLMMFLVVSGLLSALTIKQMVFPEFSLDQVEVRVDYPGALPEEVEDSIIKRIEEQIEGIDGISEIRATAAEGIGVVIVEFSRGTDVQTKLDEIKSEVDRITSFPEDAEEPQVSERTNRSRVVEIALYGEVEPRILKDLADEAKDTLAARPNISFVDVRGTQPYEVSIEISTDTLRAYNLSLTDLADIVRDNSLDLPAGEIETDGQEILVRTVGKALSGADFADIVVVTGPGGATVRLGDIATVVDGFEDTDQEILFNGQPSAYVQVFRIGEERVLDVVAAVKDFLETELRPSLPPGVSATLWRNDAVEFEARIALLIKNGTIGLLLVVTVLTLFLNTQLAFWVSAGIFVAFVGAFFVMSLLEVSLNQLSLFGFILAIGIVVDDAIVVGENIFAEQQKGRGPVDAATLGAQRIARPVIFAVLTTVLAFFPLLFLPGTLGAFLGDIPAVVIMVLALSLVEALLVLPRHLSKVHDSHGRNLLGFLDGPRRFVDRRLTDFIEGPLSRAVAFAIRYPFVTLAGGIAIALTCYGLLAGGLVRFGFAPRVEASYVQVGVELTPGTTAERTRTTAQAILQAGLDVLVEIEREQGFERDAMLKATFLSVGEGTGIGGAGPGGGAVSLPQANEATVLVELTAAPERTFPTALFEQRWRRNIPELPGVRKVTLSSSFVSVGEPVQVELSSGDTAQLSQAVAAVEAELRRLTGVFDVATDEQLGRQQATLSLRPIARAYGLTLESVARQVRGAFFGAEALRVQRDREEIRVYVRLPEEERNAIGDIRAFRVRTPSGGFVPLDEVAEIRLEVGPTAINRRDGLRIVTVSADLDITVTSAADVNGYLAENFFPDLMNRVPGFTWRFAGEQAEQSDVFSVLLRNFLLALFGIYALLAIAFRSYVQPFIVMSAIPFGLAGAILGHFVLGITMTIISIFGVVGLSGVIINGALVLIDFMNEAREQGAGKAQAILDGCKARFRPILLTSLTTFCGVGPLIFEPGVQAQFLIPLAVSIGFGVLFGTPIFMLIVPALVSWQSGAARSLSRGEAD
ncbi:MAG: efflux RND transporter permease subunit [Alphaproteobacteria bacterium]